MAEPQISNQQASQRGDQYQDEGVCFTAGMEGAPFGAGVIHSYLAAGRKPPRVVAGISMGALTAAAFQRAYRECLNDPNSEDVRWQWYRRYLQAISENPFDVIWAGIPDQSDFFAQFIPVKDPAPETIADPQMRSYFTDAELQARRDLTLFVKLGHWLSHLPLKVGSIAEFIIQYVRFKEKYVQPRIRQFFLFLYSLLKIILVPVFHNALHPQFVNEARFNRKNEWPVVSFLAVVLMLAPALFLLGLALQFTALGQTSIYLLFTGAVTVGVLAWKYRKWRKFRPLLGWPLYGSCISASVSLVLLVVSSVAATFGWLASQLENSHQKFARAIGIFLAGFNGGVLDFVKKAATVLFIIVFVATIALLIEVMRKQRAGEASQPRPRHWTTRLLLSSRLWISLGFLLAALVLGLGIARYFFHDWFASIASRPWILHLSATLSSFKSSLAEGVLQYKVEVTGVPTAVLLYYLFGSHQPLMAGERDALCSARKRRKLSAFGIRIKPLYWAISVVVGFAGSASIRLGLHPARWVNVALLVICLLTLFPAFEYLGKEIALQAAPRVRKFTSYIASVVFSNLNLHKALVHNYYLRLGLYNLFHEDHQEPILHDTPFPAVLVAAPLQVIKDDQRDFNAYQVWANSESSLLDALTAALALPGLYEPVHLQAPLPSRKSPGKSAFRSWWLPQRIQDHAREVDLVDGSVIRQNPIPALFNFIAQDAAKGSKELALHLSSNKNDPRLHVVYNVPIDPAQPQQVDSNVSIVDVGLAAVKLSRRRDTQLEVHQTNLLGQMQRQLRKLGYRHPGISPVFADEIAPEADFKFNNPLNPTRAEVLDAVAAGCRATLQVLYAKEIADLWKSWEGKTVSCSALMKRISSRKEQQKEFPGLSEVCQACKLACKQQLKLPKIDQDGKVVRTSSNTWSALADDKIVFDDHEPAGAQQNAAAPSVCSLIDGTQPRIAFVASGGVFRGTFHGGMLAALLTARIKPDLIVGASVGTIMGGALAAAFSASDYEGAVQHIAELTSVLLTVDQHIAFTKQFKNASRDLGIRACGVDISPNAIRKMVLHGSRHDAAFAAVGAPSALIDGISHLLMIPHKRTGEIAAEFVAGHVTTATNLLLQQLQTETLRRLNIEYSLIGTSLLQPTATRLFSAQGTCLQELQPFKHRGILLFGTTVDYWRQRPALLGTKIEGRGPLYNFVEAALCSSAFPCVFSTRRESDLFPGTGSPTTLFSDGGMFDNLPFLPAAEILAKAQVRQIRHEKENDSSGRSSMDVSLDSLKRRWEQPDLFIAGSLDVNLQRQQDIDNTFENITEIIGRASALQNNNKIKSFEHVLMTLDEQIGDLLEFAPSHPHKDKLSETFIDNMVNASLLPVYPADPQHLNGTFAFCASTGLDQGRLKDSIADGCFQTFRALVNPDAASDLAPRNNELQERQADGTFRSIARALRPTPLQRSFEALKECGKMPEIAWQVSAVQVSAVQVSPVKENAGPSPFTVIPAPITGECKFFRRSSFQPDTWPSPAKHGPLDNFACPFYRAADQIKAKRKETEDTSQLRIAQKKRRLKSVKAIAQKCRELERAAAGPETQQRLRRAEELLRRTRDSLLQEKKALRAAVKESKQQEDSIREIYQRCVTDEVHIRLRNAERSGNAGPLSSVSTVPEESAAPATVISK